MLTLQLKHELIRRVGYLLFHAFTFKARNLKRVIPQHWHQSTEIIYCLSGKLNVWINQNLYVMGCGDILVINSNTIHSTQSPCPNHVLCIQLPLPFLQTITENQYLKSFSFDLNTTQASSLQFKKLQKILNDITKIVDQDIADISLSDKIEEHSLILKLVSDLVSNHSKIAPKKSLHRSKDTVQLMDKITSYINSHVDKRINLHQIAQEFNYSDSYFSKIFKNGFDMNFHDFITSVRLNDALTKMTTTNISIQEIAVLSGFETYRNFYNSFTKVYQISPLEYRVISQKKTSSNT